MESYFKDDDRYELIFVYMDFANTNLGSRFASVCKHSWPRVSDESQLPLCQVEFGVVNSLVGPGVNAKVRLPKLITCERDPWVTIRNRAKTARNPEIDLFLAQYLLQYCVTHHHCSSTVPGIDSNSSTPFLTRSWNSLACSVLLVLLLKVRLLV